MSNQSVVLQDEKNKEFKELVEEHDGLTEAEETVALDICRCGKEGKDCDCDAQYQEAVDMELSNNTKKHE